jgi:hypothetical protein
MEASPMTLERMAAHGIYSELVDALHEGPAGIYLTVRAGDTDTGISVKLSHVRDMPALLRALADEIEAQDAPCREPS